MTKVIPIATRPEIDTCRRTLSRFSGVRKRGDSAVKATTSSSRKSGAA